MSVAAAAATASASGRTRSSGRAWSVGITGSLDRGRRWMGSAVGADELRGLANRVDRERVAAPGLQRLAEQVDLATARRLEGAVDRLDAVQPRVDMDVVGLGGDVSPELAAPALREELDAQRRAWRHGGRDRSHHDADLATGAAQPRAEPAVERWPLPGPNPR